MHHTCINAKSSTYVLPDEETEWDAPFLDEPTKHPHKKKEIILHLERCKGLIPPVFFERKEEYRIVEKYAFTCVSKQWWRYTPDREDLVRAKSKKWVKSHSVKSDEKKVAEFNKYLSSITPSPEKYRKHLVKCAGKLKFCNTHLRNEQAFDLILGELLTAKKSQRGRLEESGGDTHGVCVPLVNLSYEAIIEIVKEGCLRHYSPRLKMVVFNRKYSHLFTSIAKQVIQQKAIGEINEMQILIAYTRGLSPEQISDSEGLCIATVYKHLKKNKHLTKSKSELTKEKIREWRKSNKKGIQKECAKALDVGIATVKRYWNK